MPKTSKQRRGEIIKALRRYENDIITEPEFRNVLRGEGAGAKSTMTEYRDALMDEGAIARIPGGFRLTEASKKNAVITITITPYANKGDVIRALTSALQQFKPLTTMEIEE